GEGEDAQVLVRIAERDLDGLELARARVALGRCEIRLARALLEAGALRFGQLARARQVLLGEIDVALQVVRQDQAGVVLDARVLRRKSRGIDVRAVALLHAFARAR